MDEYVFIDGPYDGKRICVAPYVPEVRLVHDESFVYYHIKHHCQKQEKYLKCLFGKIQADTF